MKKRQKFMVKEIFKSIQGEGFHNGKVAIFVRFSGCNLWDGIEAHRKNAICNFCDTDFVGINGQNGGKYSHEELVEKIFSIWNSAQKCFIIFTGGEPALQLDEKLISLCKEKNAFTAIETNGSLEVPENIDWICLSPKAKDNLKISKVDECKFIYPQAIDPSDFEYLETNNFYLQPLYNDEIEDNIKKTLQYCLDNPKWRISLQLHKILGID